jgi:hypothetical protein
METSDLSRLRQLQDENRRKDRIVARMALEIDAMKELVEKKPGALAEARSCEGAPPAWNIGRSSVRSDRLQPQPGRSSCTFGQG